jgi:hypothetical protein
VAGFIAHQLQQQRKPRRPTRHNHRGQQRHEQSGIGRGKAAKPNLHPQIDRL